ncbi:hypothetical protein [Paenibacillus cymbidii]|uniref:hypothetical protein n=1 Tax=Paenibacillus cymbidii TaxID=1639034 RepID=UPI001080B003|nr:hypothetical protein [Paenibacillus cymbidii]
MGLLDWFRENFSGEKTCPPEHLESYKRLGEQVYELQVELSSCQTTRALAFLQAARSLQTLADALLGDVFSSSGKTSKTVPVVTHEQADLWYGRITDLLVAARQEAAFAGTSPIALPIKLGGLVEGPKPCPIDHLSGLRRAADKMEDMVKDHIGMARMEGERYKEAILLYEDARTRKQAGDSIVGTITTGRRVSPESHEDAEEQYERALSSYFLVA